LRFAMYFGALASFPACLSPSAASRGKFRATSVSAVSSSGTAASPHLGLRTFTPAAKLANEQHFCATSVGHRCSPICIRHPTGPAVPIITCLAPVQAGCRADTSQSDAHQFPHASQRLSQQRPRSQVVERVWETGDSKYSLGNTHVGSETSPI
jgi:hypothetical protein